MAKTATFGVLHLGTSFSVTYGLTGSLSIAGIVTFVEPLVNTVMHYFFDKYWDDPRVEKLRARLSGVAPSRPLAARHVAQGQGALRGVEA
ncbi:MAG: DUF2061 domain-containing protein [Rubrivivax sp.]|nr:MAG: DUF2061 domain-containing protein [Rubrivivax sp.]